MVKSSQVVGTSMQCNRAPIKWGEINGEAGILLARARDYIFWHVLEFEFVAIKLPEALFAMMA